MRSYLCCLVSPILKDQKRHKNFTSDDNCTILVKRARRCRWHNTLTTQIWLVWRNTLPQEKNFFAFLAFQYVAICNPKHQIKEHCLCISMFVSLQRWVTWHAAIQRLQLKREPSLTVKVSISAFKEFWEQAYGGWEGHFLISYSQFYFAFSFLILYSHFSFCTPISHFCTPISHFVFLFLILHSYFSFLHFHFSFRFPTSHIALQFNYRACSLCGSPGDGCNIL